MKKILTILSILVIFTQTIFANEQEMVKKQFLEKIEQVVSIVKNKTLTKEERNSKIVTTLTPMFDFELMAKLSLGKKWKRLNKDDRKKFVKLYVERMKKSYSSKLDAYSDEKVEIKKIVQPKPNRMVLITDLVSSNDKLEISYKFYKSKKIKPNKHRWLIYDVVIIGVSILKADKAQFREYLQTHSISQLMDSFKN